MGLYIIFFCDRKYSIAILGLLCYNKDNFTRLERGAAMRICYNKLWKMLIDRNMKKYQLRERAHISSNAIAKLGRNENINTDILCKICECLECNIGDICEFRNNVTENEKDE